MTAAGSASFGKLCSDLSGMLTPIEREIILLNVIIEMITSMVNYSIFEKNHGASETQLRFKTSAHQRLFNILLVDFLSTPKGEIFRLPNFRASSTVERSFLGHLEYVCGDPQLGSTPNLIINPLLKFKTWLETECVIEKVWFPSIGAEVDLKIARISFIKICGNISKHNFARLDVDSNNIRKILSANSVEIDEYDAYLVIPEFYEWFHRDIFNYHSSAIAEFLNNIWWGIYEYLKPEFARSFIKEAGIAYSFSAPANCTHPFATKLHWDLMNKVRSAPFVPRFEVTNFLKMRY